MPIEPVILPKDGWLRIPLELPGRVVQLRVWQATVGRVKLYLLDSNDPLNAPVDRGITAKLYGGGSEIRLMQEIILGVGGWRVVEALHPDVEICHINEGHAAFAIIERARHLAVKSKLNFWQALWAVRAGNIFTTHTPVAAGFDTFSPDLVAQISALCRRRIGRARSDGGRYRRPGADRSAKSRRAVQHGLSRRAGIRALSRREPSAWRIQPADIPAAVPALADLRGSGGPCDERGAYPDLGLDRGRPYLDRCLRQGTLARYAG